MLIRSFAEFEALTGDDAPRQVERDLIAACQRGEGLVLGELPPEWNDTTPPDPKRNIRADLLRLLITGGTEACGLHLIGIALKGAQITGTLDLSFAKGKGRVVLNACRFAETPKFAQCYLAQLSLDDSHFPGLFSQGIKVQGGVFLRNVTANGTVDVNGAKIGGQLVCDGAKLNGAGGMALNGQGAETGGSLSLHGLVANGTVDVAGAKVGGQLACEGATFNGAGGMALNAHRTLVKQGFFFRKVKSVVGQIYLDAAHAGDLVDDIASWPTGADQLYLNGFTYDRIAVGPETFADRKDWLARGSRSDGKFYPQPYTQFARVLREAGHEGEARKVLLERQRLLNAEALKAVFDPPYPRLWALPFLPLLWLWRCLTDLLLRYVVGYGFAPVRALIIMAVLVGLSAYFFSHAYASGVMVPNSDVILTSPNWWLAVFQSPDAPTLIWEHMRPARHYETFYGLTYAFDVFVPLVDLGQQSAWSATTVNRLGWWARIGTMALEVVGWIVTALGAAAITGIMQRGKD